MRRALSALLLLSFFWLDARADQILFTNVIVNPGAEDGTASGDGQSVVVIPSWSNAGGATVVAYGTPGGFPGSSDPGPPDRGSHLFVGGAGTESVAQLFQVLDIPDDGDGAEFHHSSVLFEAQCWLGGVSSEADYAEVCIEFRGAQDEVLDTACLAPVTVADRNGTTGLLHRFVSGDVPSGTWRVVTTITMTRLDGSYNDALVDGLDVRFLTGLQLQAATWGRAKALFR